MDRIYLHENNITNTGGRIYTDGISLMNVDCWADNTMGFSLRVGSKFTFQ